MLANKPVTVHPLFSALLNNTPKQVEKMINAGADVNMRTLDGGKTPLHVACHRGDLPMVEMLLSKKADVKAITDSGFTPLHVAAQNNFNKIIIVLVKAGADVNTPTKVGCTPLHESAANGCKEATVELIGLGADRNAKDFRYHLTPAELAKIKGQHQIAAFLSPSKTAQESFIEEVNKILTPKTSLKNTAESQLIQKLAESIKDIKVADEISKKLNTTLEAATSTLVPEQLKICELLISSMSKYNKDKAFAKAEASAKTDATSTATASNTAAASP